MANTKPFGSYVPTNFIWDIQQIYETDITTPAFKELLVRLYQNINLMALALNTKESAYYPLQEFVTGAIFFPNPASAPSTGNAAPLRNEFRTLVNFGALPNGPVSTTKSVAHGINFNSAFSVTQIYGAATDPVGLNYIPLPYASASGTNNIEVYVDSTNVNVKVPAGDNRSNFTITYIVIEYIKF